MNEDTDVAWGADDRRVPTTRQLDPDKTPLRFEKRERPPEAEREPVVAPRETVFEPIPFSRRASVPRAEPKPSSKQRPPKDELPVFHTRESRPEPEAKPEAPPAARGQNVVAQPFETRPPRGPARWDIQDRARGAS